MSDMKTTLSWINDYVNIKDVSVKDFVNRMTVTGSKVEKVEKLGEDIKEVVTGKIIKLETKSNVWAMFTQWNITMKNELFLHATRHC